MLQRIKNKVVLKIAILVTLEIALIVGSFGILSYYQPQQSSLADTINIAGKNRYLTSLLMLQIERYLDRSASISNLTMAMSSLKSNIMSLKQGGFILGIQLQPLLAQQADQNFREPIVFQFIFVVLNIGILILILYLIARILKPIFILTDAMSKVKKGNLEIKINEKGNDELSVLCRSFNLMIETIRNYVKKQERLTGELAQANKELKEASQLKDDFINIAAHELRTPIQPILG